MWDKLGRDAQDTYLELQNNIRVEINSLQYRKISVQLMMVLRIACITCSSSRENKNRVFPALTGLHLGGLVGQFCSETPRQTEGFLFRNTKTNSRIFVQKHKNKQQDFCSETPWQTTGFLFRKNRTNSSIFVQKHQSNFCYTKKVFGPQ